jgi:hypothetical protein
MRAIARRNEWILRATCVGLALWNAWLSLEVTELRVSVRRAQGTADNAVDDVTKARWAISELRDRP